MHALHFPKKEVLTSVKEKRQRDKQFKKRNINPKSASDGFWFGETYFPEWGEQAVGEAIVIRMLVSAWG